MSRYGAASMPATSASGRHLVLLSSLLASRTLQPSPPADVGRAKERACEVRDLLRAPAAPALGRTKRVRSPAEFPRADRARRPARLRLRVARRAPLPRGVLTLLGTGGLPRGSDSAHSPHPPWARHRPAADEPSDSRGRARGDARPAVGRTRRARARRGAGARRAPSVRPASARQARGLGGSGAGPGPGVHAPSLG